MEKGKLKMKRPIMKNDEILKALAKRTSIPFNTVFTIIASYHDIIKTCIEEGVEVKMGELGVMTWKVMKPKYGKVYYDMIRKKKMEPMDLPGYTLPLFKIKPSWREEIKKKTEFWDEVKEGSGADEDAL